MTNSRGDDKRPIDRVRESALAMQIGGAEDGTISVMIDMGMALYVVKEHAIYAGQFRTRSTRDEPMLPSRTRSNGSYRSAVTIPKPLASS